MTFAYEKAALRIMSYLHVAEDDLVGTTVQTFNGEAGMCKDVKLDDHHGLCFTLDDPVRENGHGGARRWYPVSTIRMKS